MGNRGFFTLKWSWPLQLNTNIIFNSFSAGLAERNNKSTQFGIKYKFIIGLQRLQSFPISSKFHWAVGPVNLKLLPDQKKIHQTLCGQFLPCETKKKTKIKTDQKINWIVGPIWLGISLDLPLFYMIKWSSFYQGCLLDEIKTGPLM